MASPRAEEQTQVEETGDRPVSPDPERRIWKRRNAAHGSTFLSLKAFAVLYDVGRGLTRQELADELRQRLVPTEIAYLQAWHLRRLRQVSQCIARHRKPSVIAVSHESAITTSIERALLVWLSLVFCKRVNQGHTLVRDADGRYMPGPRSPRIQTLDGQLIPYTPAVRHELEQADRAAGRAHLALLEWKKALAAPDMVTVDARAQVLIYLARRLFIGTNRKLFPLDERQLSSRFLDLLHLADTPTVKRAVFERVCQDLIALL